MPQHNINLIFNNVLNNDHKIVMTHGDLHPRNIIIKNYKIAAIIDWEHAGFYPEYWEYTKIICSIQWDNIWVPMVCKFLDQYTKEFSFIYYLRSIFYN